VPPLDRITAGAALLFVYEGFPIPFSFLHVQQFIHSFDDYFSLLELLHGVLKFGKVLCIAT